jgi:hypothetical protein
MSKENKVHTAIMLTMMTILILLIGFGIGKFICGKLQTADLILSLILGLLSIPLLYIGVVEFIVQAVIDEERSKR